MTATSNSDITFLKNLAKSEEYKQFCNLLNETHTEEIKLKLQKKETIEPIDYAKAEIYSHLAELPKNLYL